ncbi:Fic family protein [Euzebya tangerina]|uniref:Fic family protein n=1 Tax=Euzebya tangerina TaxID=591198 RepID=UPI000E320F93|nr:Fic family protein [Euzebya tangerina]
MSLRPTPGAAHAPGDESWPRVAEDTSRIWTPQAGRRLPAADRRVHYTPSLPAAIAGRRPQLSADTINLITEAAAALIRSDARNSGRSILALLRTESAASSKIEQLEVKQRYVSRALAGLPTTQRSAKDVAANLHALELALARAHEPVTPATIDAVHRTLLPDEVWSGDIRTVQNWIGGSDYSPRGARHVPPDPAHLPRLMTDLSEFITGTDIPAIAQAAITHAQFETIHPYMDGNGRVGRALTHLVLRRRAITPTTTAPLSVAILGDPDNYLESLSGYENGEVDAYVADFAKTAMIAATMADTLADHVDSIVDEWQAIPEVAGSRPDSVIHRIVPDLPSRPVTTVSLSADRHGVSAPAARNALETLTDVGVLNRTTAARNVQIYEAHEIFAAVEDIERTARGV